MRNIFIVVFLLSLCLPAEAQYFQMDLMKKRQSNKESTRWTLADWLSQKQRIGLWDHWLSVNRSANWFEMQLSGHQFDYELTSDNGSGKVKIDESSKLYALDLWVTILGLRAEYEERDGHLETRSGMLSLRLVGASLQSTHILLRGGLQVTEDSSSGEEWENPFSAGVLKMYFLSFIGLEGEYRHFFPKKSHLGTQLKGTRIRGGAFIEYGIFQVSGHYWKEPMEFSSSGITTKQEREGYDVGIALLF